MISRERLEKLICKDIYCICDDIICEVIATREYINACDWYEDLYETKEEAEFAMKYKNIQRTETLNLPTWEELENTTWEDTNKLERYFYTPLLSKYCFMPKIKTIGSYDKENPYIIRIFNYGNIGGQIDYEYTKENYLFACEIAKKLFLGESE